MQLVHIVEEEHSRHSGLHWMQVREDESKYWLDGQLHWSPTLIVPVMHSLHPPEKLSHSLHLRSEQRLHESDLTQPPVQVFKQETTAEPSIKLERSQSQRQAP